MFLSIDISFHFYFFLVPVLAKYAYVSVACLPVFILKCESIFYMHRAVFNLSNKERKKHDSGLSCGLSFLFSAWNARIEQYSSVTFYSQQVCAYTDTHRFACS